MLEGPTSPIIRRVLLIYSYYEKGHGNLNLIMYEGPGNPIILEGLSNLSLIMRRVLLIPL